MGYSFFRKIWKSNFTKSSSIWIIIAIAIVPLIMAQQIARSMIEGISLRIIETESSHLSLLLYPSIKSDERIQLRLAFEKTPEVKFAYEELRGVGLMRNGTRKLGINFRGVDSNFFEEAGVINYLQLLDGQMKLNNSNSVVIGSALASQLDLSVGDEAMFLTTQTTGGIALPKISRAIVEGIVSTGYEDLDKIWVFIQKAQLQKMLPPNSQEWRIGIKIHDPFILQNELVKRNQKSQELGRHIQYTLHGISQKQGTLHTWYDLNRNKYTLFLSTNLLLNITLLIAVILAVITLSSAISMRTIDLELEIATLKAIGAHPPKLERQIVLLGFWYGLVGSIVGSAIGLLLASQINYLIQAVDIVVNTIRNFIGKSEDISVFNPEFYLTSIDFKFYPIDLLVIIGSVVLLSCFCSWFPARKVRNISSLKLLRRH